MNKLSTENLQRLRSLPDNAFEEKFVLLHWRFSNHTGKWVRGIDHVDLDPDAQLRIVRCVRYIAAKLLDE